MRKRIFVVTTLKFGIKKYPDWSKHAGKKHWDIIDNRTVAWYSSLRDAQRCVEENALDIYGEGDYPWALIEETMEGVYPDIKNEWWYKWKGKKKSKKGKYQGKYVLAKKPIAYKRVVNFGIG